MKKEVVFNFGFRDQFLVNRIVNRFMKDQVNKENFDKKQVEMSFRAANGVNGNEKIDLLKLESADDFNFFHDMMGIIEHMNTTTGKLDGFFVPRCAIMTEEK